MLLPSDDGFHGHCPIPHRSILYSWQQQLRHPAVQADPALIRPLSERRHMPNSDVRRSHVDRALILLLPIVREIFQYSGIYAIRLRQVHFVVGSDLRADKVRLHDEQPKIYTRT